MSLAIVWLLCWILVRELMLVAFNNFIEGDLYAFIRVCYSFNLIGIIVSNCINCVKTFLCWLLSSAESDNFFLLLLRLILINLFVMVLGVTRLRGNFVIFLKTVPSYLVAYALFFIRIFIFPTYEGYSFIYFNVYNLYKFKISFSKINMTLYIYIYS